MVSMVSMVSEVSKVSDASVVGQLPGVECYNETVELRRVLLVHFEQAGAV